MKIIDKILRGRPLKTTVLDKLDEIIDYLRATRIVGGHGITATETAAGLVISVNGASRAKDEEDDYAFVTAGPGVCISGTSEDPAVAGSTVSSVPINGATFSLLLEAGTDNVSITDGANGSKVISVTGSTSGGGLDIPPYSALSFGGGAPEYGLGHTFIVAVKKGNVGFWDEGGGAVGKWTNKNGTSSQALTNKTAYNASEDGWMRISVVDDGSAPGECLSFFSPTGGFPLYKYGTFGSTVSGICYPDYKELGTVTGAPAADLRGTGTTYLLPVYAGITVKWYSSGSNVFARYAPGIGVSVTGATAANLAKDTDFPVLANGWVRISVIDEGTIENSCLRFYVNDNDVTSYLSLYRYNKFQRLRGDGTTIQVDGDVISYIGGSTSSGGLGYPDYIALAGGGTASNALGEITDEDYNGTLPSASSIPQDPVFGITHILPVPAHAPIKYYASAPILVRFAPEAGGSGHSYYDLFNEMEWTPNCPGWLRISILDDGSHSTDCIRLYVGGEDYSDAVAMHKCGRFQNLTGDNTTISVQNGVISYIGSGSGSSGSTNAPNWGYAFGTGNQNGSTWIGNATAEITETETSTSQTTVTPYTVPSGGGWIYAFATISGGQGSFSGAAHLNINGALFKVAEASGTGYASFGSSICIPVAGGAKVKWYTDTSNATIYKGCVFYQ